MLDTVWSTGILLTVESFSFVIDVPLYFSFSEEHLCCYMPLTFSSNYFSNLAYFYGYHVVERFVGHGIGTMLHSEPLILHHGEYLLDFTYLIDIHPIG
jgi:hypothetical protein